MQLYNEPITTAGATSSGVPETLHWRGSRMHTGAVRAVWQAPGEARVYRVGVEMDGGQRGIAELAVEPDAVRLRYLWL